MNLQRPERKLVGPSGPKRPTSKDEEMVFTEWQHSAVLADGICVASECEKNSWSVNSLGGYFYSLNLSDKLREALQPESRFRQFCDARDAGGKNKGETFTWTIVNNVATAGGTLVETNTMPETQFTIAQATLTITEYGNSVLTSALLH